MKIIKKDLITWFTVLFLLSIFIINISYSGEECKYQGKISQCLEANKSKTTRSIEDFVCIIWNEADITYQVILDEKFKEVDDKIEKYLDDLEKNKSFYFWKDAKASYLDWVDAIEKKLAINWEFFKEFKKLCWTEIIQDAISCSETKSTPVIKAKDFFNSNWVTCMSLVTVKLYIARQVAFNILHLNKGAVRKDEHKEYVKEERSKYDKLLESMNINSWYMERVMKKWPSKTYNAH